MALCDYDCCDYYGLGNGRNKSYDMIFLIQYITITNFTNSSGNPVSVYGG